LQGDPWDGFDLLTVGLGKGGEPTLEKTQGDVLQLEKKHTGKGSRKGAGKMGVATDQKRGA